MSLPRRSLIAVFVLVSAACGDPDTDDQRGYTKAPLEQPALVIRGETPSEMSRYGAPNRVQAEELRVAVQTPVTPPDQPAQTVVELPPGVTQEMVTQGQQLFGASGNCFACHGAGAVGGPLAPALNDAAWLHIDGSFESIEQIINAGVSVPKQSAAQMPPRGGAQITGEQVRQLAAYVYSISR